MITALALFLPLITWAQGTGGKVCATEVQEIADIICKIGSILKLVTPILYILGLVYFIWGVVSYVIGGDDEAKKKGKDKIIYGLIGFVVIFAYTGIITVVIDTFGINPGSADYINDFVQNNADIVSASTATCALPASPKLGDLFIYGTCLINNAIIPFIASLAVAMFIWGVVQYVINDSDEAKKSKGKSFMIWGIIGLTVMIGVWGLVRIVGTTFGIEYAIPQLAD